MEMKLLLWAEYNVLQNKIYYGQKQLELIQVRIIQSNLLKNIQSANLQCKKDIIINVNAAEANNVLLNENRP